MRVERDVAAPAGSVWAVVTDLEGSASTLSGIIAVERLDDGDAFAVGTRWNETRKMFGKSSTEEMEVTALDEGRSYTVESFGNGAHYTSVMIVEPKGEGSVLSMSFEGEPTNLVARIGAIFGRLFEGSMRKMLETDLAEIAAAAEARSDGGAVAPAGDAQAVDDTAAHADSDAASG